MPRTLNVVCLLAREAGLICLKKLSQDKHFNVLAVATHPFLPASESSVRKERPEFSEFQKITGNHKIKLLPVHSKKEALLDELMPMAPWDALISCSWRFHVSMNILSQARIGNINLHRGKLPLYRGAEPVKRALLNGDAEVTVTAHGMVDEIDAGPVLAERSQPVLRLPGESLERSVERIKKEILPLYPEVLWMALNPMEATKHV